MHFRIVLYLYITQFYQLHFMLFSTKTYCAFYLVDRRHTRCYIGRHEIIYFHFPMIPRNKTYYFLFRKFSIFDERFVALDWYNYYVMLHFSVLLMYYYNAIFPTTFLFHDSVCIFSIFFVHRKYRHRLFENITFSA